MKKRRFLFGLAAALSGVSCLFRSCGHFSASAADSSRTLTPAQTRALLGDTLNFTYYNGSDYVTGELQYLTNVCVLQTDDENGNPINYFQYASNQQSLFDTVCPSGTAWICYYGNFPDFVPGQGTYYSAEISPRIEFSGVTLSKFAAGFSCSSDYSPQMRYAPFDRVDYYVNGNPVSTENFWQNPSSTAGFAYEQPFHFRIGSTLGRWFTLAPVYYQSDTQAIVSNINFKRQGDIDGNPASGVTIRFIVSCPTLSEIGTISGSTGSVGSDLTATNIKLDTIINLLSQIAHVEQEDDSDDGETPENDAPEYEVNSDFENSMDSAIDNSGDLFRAAPNLSGSDDLLGYVWQIIQIMHLDTIFSVLCVLFILKFVIFKK